MMSHVDEGALHAYLDGALDEYPAAEAQRVREHLEVCAACRERLEAERRIREDAASILAMAAPEVEVPSFEELRAYVRANAARRGSVSVRLYRLGWAASVVLALGTGWLLRGGDVVPVSAPDEAVTVAPRAADAATPPAEAPSTRAATLESSTVVAEEAASPLDEVVVRGGRESTGAQASERQDDALVVGNVEPAGAPAPATDRNVSDVAQRRGLAVPITVSAAPATREPTPPNVTADAVVVAVDSARVVDAAAQAAAGAGGAARAERRRPSSPSDVVTSADAVVVAPPAALVGAADFDDARDDAALEQEEQPPLSVFGLEVLEVLFRGETTSVLQRLESGDTLRIIHLPAELDPASLEAADTRDRELTLQVATGGWIVMRAPVDERELLELMDRLLGER